MDIHFFQRQMEGWMDRKKKKDGWIDIKMDGWMERKNRWMDENNRWMVVWI